MDFYLSSYLKLIYKFSNLVNIKKLNRLHHILCNLYAYDYLKNKIKNLYFLYDFQIKILISSKKNMKKRNLICYSHKSNDFINLLKKLPIQILELCGFTLPIDKNIE